MPTEHLDIFRTDTRLQIYGGRLETTSNLECRHENEEVEDKKGISCMLLIPLVYRWLPPTGFGPVSSA